MMRSLVFACLAIFAAPVAAQEVHPVDGTPLAADQSFSYAIPAQFPSLDPQLIQGVIASQIANQIYEPLVRQAPDGSPAPGVAARWISEADRVWTFELRDDARWSNGDPVTAEDFAHAWRRAADPATGSPYAWYVELAAIENAAAVIAGDAPTDALGVEVLDAHTLRVTLDRPVAHLPGMLSYATFMPVHRPTLAAHGDGW
ncbi:MAG: ABC transporter substrate-binding protein, partial [Pseudomonadota bacterium]